MRLRASLAGAKRENVASDSRSCRPPLPISPPGRSLIREGPSVSGRYDPPTTTPILLALSRAYTLSLYHCYMDLTVPYDTLQRVRLMRCWMTSPLSILACSVWQVSTDSSESWWDAACSPCRCSSSSPAWAVPWPSVRSFDPPLRPLMLPLLRRLLLLMLPPLPAMMLLLLRPLLLPTVMLPRPPSLPARSRAWSRTPRAWRRRARGWVSDLGPAYIHPPTHAPLRGLVGDQGPESTHSTHPSTPPTHLPTRALITT